jgi:hypothetical protein
MLRTVRRGETGMRLVTSLRRLTFVWVSLLVLCGSAPASGWHRQEVPAPMAFALDGVSRPVRDFCIAVGSRGISPDAVFPAKPFAERWNGQGWAIQRVPVPAGAGSGILNAVDCLSSRACVGVGSYETRDQTAHALVARWIGRRWSLQDVPKPPNSALLGIACSSITSCTAVGDVIERYDGKSWRIETKLPQNEALNGIACFSTTSCLAVGSSSYVEQGGYSAGLTMYSPFSERWDGKRWASVPTTVDDDGSGEVITGMACASPADCFAVAVNESYSGGWPDSIDHWNGRDWTDARQSYATLQGIWCGPTRLCTAVGGNLIEDRTADRWRIQRTFSSEVGLNAVSCVSEGMCTAVGSIDTGTTERVVVFVEHATQH